MIGAVSVLTDYALVYSEDPALTLAARPPPPDALPDDTEDTYRPRVEAWQKAIDEIVTANRALFERAMETGEWAAITKPGETPTVFRVRIVPGSTWAAYERILRDDKLGDREAQQLAFRLAVTTIDNAPGVPLAKAEHVDRRGVATGLGVILTAATVDAIDTVSRKIVAEVGTLVRRQRGGPQGK